MWGGVKSVWKRARPHEGPTCDSHNLQPANGPPANGVARPCPRPSALAPDSANGTSPSATPRPQPTHRTPEAASAASSLASTCSLRSSEPRARPFRGRRPAYCAGRNSRRQHLCAWGRRARGVCHGMGPHVSCALKPVERILSVPLAH